MRNEVYIVGASGHAKVVISTFRAAGWSVLGAFDDDPGKWGKTILGAKVLGPTGELSRLVEGRRAVVAIGDNRVRRKVAGRFPHLEWATVVHPRAWVDPSVRIGRGTVVFAGAVLQPDSSVGSHAIINTGATIDHDCRLGDYVQLAPGSHLGGTVTVETGAFLGVGSSVVPNTHVGAWSVIGAGAVVAKDLEGHVKAVGVPAKVIERMVEAV